MINAPLELALNWFAKPISRKLHRTNAYESAHAHCRWYTSMHQTYDARSVQTQQDSDGSESLATKPKVTPYKQMHMKVHMLTAGGLVSWWPQSVHPSLVHQLVWGTSRQQWTERGGWMVFVVCVYYVIWRGFNRAVCAHERRSHHPAFRHRRAWAVENGLDTSHDDASFR